MIADTDNGGALALQWYTAHVDNRADDWVYDVALSRMCMHAKLKIKKNKKNKKATLRQKHSIPIKALQTYRDI